MRKRVMVVAGFALALVLLGAALAVPTFAQGPTATATPTPKLSVGCWGWGFGLRGGSWATYDAVAEALGLTPEALFSELHSGKTLAQIAEAKGVTMEAVQEAIKAAQKEAAKERIEQAVTDGRLTREQADWLMKGFDLGFRGGRLLGRAMMGLKTTAQPGVPSLQVSSS